VDGVAYQQQFVWTYDAIGRLTHEALDVIGSPLPLGEGQGEGIVPLADYAVDYIFDLVGNRRYKLTNNDADGEIDEQITYDYDPNDRLLTELAELIAADQTRTTKSETLYEFGPNANPVGDEGGDWTMQTKKTVLNAAGSPVSTVDYFYNLQNRMAHVEISTLDPATGTEVRRETLNYRYGPDGKRERGRTS
jgi:hypothetical protein